MGQKTELQNDPQLPEVDVDQTMNQRPVATHPAQKLFDVIALPAPGVIVNPVKRKNGQTYDGQQDMDGFYHWKLPRPYAQALCLETAGLRHCYTDKGTMTIDWFEVRRPKGLHLATVRVKRHMRTVINGKATYKPYDEV